MKRLTATLAALALTAAAPAAAAPQPLEPAPETVEGSELEGAVYWLLPVLVLIALIIAMTAGDDEATPASP